MMVIIIHTFFLFKEKIIPHEILPRTLEIEFTYCSEIIEKIVLNWSFLNYSPCHTLLYSEDFFNLSAPNDAFRFRLQAPVMHIKKNWS